VHYTISDTPILSTLIRWVALLFLKCAGWRAEGRLPDIPKFVLIAAPHSSNWDAIFMLAVAFVLRVKLFWMGKDILFRRPFGWLFRWFGGIPIDRTTSHNVVAQSIQAFDENEELIMALSPEGTRKKVRYWRTGFYYIATGANVPIVLGFLDFKRKAGGVGPTIHPTGDIEADMETIQAFYATVTPKYPDQSGWATIAPKD
jgi:1-acyl-sn-glycerol-3-phosphate acyltransferase